MLRLSKFYLGGPLLMTNEYPQALTIAGSDSDGSAGMQADLHTFFARQVYGTSVITACVAGNSYLSLIHI